MFNVVLKYHVVYTLQFSVISCLQTIQTSLSVWRLWYRIYYLRDKMTFGNKNFIEHNVLNTVKSTFENDDRWPLKISIMASKHTKHPIQYFLLSLLFFLKLLTLLIIILVRGYSLPENSYCGTPYEWGVCIFFLQSFIRNIICCWQSLPIGTQ